MKRRNSTRHALLMSIISLMLCLSMLVGTTFAWFTDEVVSGKNQIIAGNLDVELEYSKDMSENSWNPVGGKTDLLDPNARWEPGHTEVVYLRVSNQGTLALKYSFQMSFVDTVVGKSVLGNDIYLSKYLKCALLEDVTAKFATRADARVEAEKKATDLVTFTGNGQLEAGAAPETMALVVYMPESVTNEANYRGTAVPQIDMGLRLFATQMMKESDSFGYTYDEQAAVFTVADANALLQENKDVALVNCVEPDGVLAVPANYTGTLVLDNVSIASIQQVEPIMTAAEDGTVAVAAEEIKIIILGNVQVKATQEGMSAITATKLNIAGSGTLTAVAKDKAAFGIGGMDTTSITMKDLTVAYVEGGEAGGVGSDTKYYKDAPEGGAAIGSGKDGAVITLTNVNVQKAIGGSKAAAIGARYHTGVTVNITDSTIGYAEGGVSAAAIGGSRVSGDATESGVTINIANSTVTAKGGVYGAGIGSGYDTHCLKKQPLCTINITDSDITATGGQYAAGVGTGYHNAALAGEIKNSTVKAVSGEKVYKTEYTAAMDIGFGVTDPTREGLQTDSKLVYNGTEITLASAPDVVAPDENVNAALQDNATVLLQAGTYAKPALSGTKNVTIIGEEGTVITGINSYGFGENTTIKNVDFQGSNAVRYGYTNGNVVFEDCTFDGEIYGFHVDNANGGTITFNNCTFVGFNALAATGTYTFNECTFLYSGSQGHTNMWGTGYFNNCTWGDETSVGRGGEYPGTGKVVIDGTDIGYQCDFIGSASTLGAFRRNVDKSGAKKDQRYVLVDDIDLAGIYWYPVKGAFAGTFDGNGHTIYNMDLTHEYITSTTSVGFFNNVASTAVIKNVTFDNAKVFGTHYVAVILAGEWNETANARIENCQVLNSTVTCDTDASSDNGDKAGAICGYATSVTIRDCLVKDTTIQAYRDFGGIIGYANGGSYHKCIIENNTVENVTLVIDNEVNYKNYTTDAEHDGNPVIGEAASQTVAQNNTVK